MLNCCTSHHHITILKIQPDARNREWHGEFKSLPKTQYKIILMYLKIDNLVYF